MRILILSYCSFVIISELSRDCFLLLNMFMSLRISLETWRLLTSIRFCLYWLSTL